MKKFGMVIAIGREVKGVLEAFGKVEKIQNKPYDTYLVSRENALIYVAVSGMGEISAAGATEDLIAKYGRYSTSVSSGRLRNASAARTSRLSKKSCITKSTRRQSTT